MLLPIVACTIAGDAVGICQLLHTLAGVAVPLALSRFPAEVTVAVKRDAFLGITSYFHLTTRLPTGTLE